jgi:putative membrane-bound dehydrogenase-like protein
VLINNNRSATVMKETYRNSWLVPRVLPLAFAVANLMAAPSSAATGDSHYAVGVAKVDITPAYPIRLNGFGFRRAESEGITQRIWAKAIAIGTDDEKPLVLIAIDSCGIRSLMVEEVAKRLRNKAGIDRDHIAVTFTHSHTTPKVNGACDTIFSSPIPPQHQQHIDRYTRELTDALEHVALAALADRQPARLEWAIGSVGFAKNRRTPGGPVDHSLPMLVVRSAESDTVRAIYVTYACHCVTLSNNKVSGDWAGYAQEAIERNHPGAVALVSIGCGSDSNPDPADTGGNIAAAAEQGAQIAQEVERLLAGELRPLSGKATATLEMIDLPLNERPTRAELIVLAATDEPAAYNAKFQLAKLDRGERLLTAIEYPIQTWSFGNSLAMVFLAGEVCVDYSLRLKELLDVDRIWLHSYANDFCCYIPSERLLREGGYGGGSEAVYFALPTTLAAGLENKIITEVLTQVPEQFHQDQQQKNDRDRDESSSQTSRLQPTKPEQVVAAMQTHGDFVVELMAAEPLIADPVAIDFGADGRLWVVQMQDYSRGVDEKFEQSGSVKVLIDRDEDGRFDEASTFVDGLRFPTDVKVWRQGVIVCDAPDVIYLEDTDGDGSADLRKTLLTGFATHNAQARVNSLRWGLDNWLYGSCGLFGGRIRSSSGKETELGSRDFRFRPDTGEIEPVTGKTQQGRARDDWGHWFGCENGALCDHYPLSDQYLARNPYVAPPATEVSVPAGNDPKRLFPLSKPVLFQESGPPGRPTSVCGLEIYRDELLGQEFRGNVFVAEPVNQLVHRLALSPRGVTFAGYRGDGESQREFLASTDNWFRPVQIRTGLDGCLWIVDMCRYVIEHPRFIPEETLRTLDPRAGHSAGRIYRVRPLNVTPRELPRMDWSDTAALVAALDSPNGPTRDLAHQMLIERSDASAVPLLEKLYAESERPESRLQTLCALDGLEALGAELLLRALRDPHAGVRAHAIRLSEPFLAGSPGVGDVVLSLIGDDAPQVQLQLAYTLGEWNNPSVHDALAGLVWKHHDDPYRVSAVLSSIGRDNAANVLRAILLEAKQQDMPAAVHDAVVMIATKFGDDPLIRDTWAALHTPRDGTLSASHLEALAEFLEALDKRQRNQLLRSDHVPSPDIERVVSAAQQILATAESGAESTLAALRILAISGRGAEELPHTLGELLGPQNPPEVQQAIVKLLSEMNPSIASDILLAHWSGYTPALRSQVKDAFFSRDDLLPFLLEAIEQSEVSPAQFDATERNRMLSHNDPAICEAAIRIFEGAINADRKKVIESYVEAARSSGEVSRGRILFQKHCASCHRLEEQGHAVGPDLAALTDRTTASLLEAVFDPNRTVDERYQSYVAVTDEGRTHVGILAGETANSITLVEQEGKQHTLLRSELEQLSNSGTSLMPEGFEKVLSPPDISDLFAYMATNGKSPKKLSGNEPAVVRPATDGAIWLLATKCEIYGQQIVYESPFENIGYWHGDSDHVVWTVELPKADTFDVFLHWSCADDSSGNAMILEGGGSPIRTTVDSTGAWSQYEIKQIGQARLSAGRHRIVVRPDGRLVSRALMDLRGVYLIPTKAAAKTPFDKRAIHGLHPPDATTVIIDLLVDLPVGTPQEYERMTSIWETSIAAGRRNNALELQRLLKFSIPAADEPLREWQAVVVGGGIINGLSQKGVWPRRRILELLRGNELLMQRWSRMIGLAADMANHESVRGGTRYDALRILGADEYKRSGHRLVKYLDADVPPELQMGAVSGLSDIESSAAAIALINAFGNYTKKNEQLAVEGLLRTEERVAVLLLAIESGKIARDSLTAEQLKKLPNVENPAAEKQTRGPALSQ